jgi:hypothetical protein
MKYTIKDFADKALIPYTDFYNQALKLFQTIHFYGSEGVAEPILNDNDVIVDFKMTEPYRVCRRLNILRDYSDEKTKLYPRN